MAKDKRYITVKNLFTGGFIKSLADVFDNVPKTVVARDLGMHHQTFGKLIESPDRFTFKDVYRIASLIDIDKWEMIKLIYNESVPDKKSKKK